MSTIDRLALSCVNGLYKLNNLDVLDDIRSCFLGEDLFSYSFTPVKKTPEGTYVKESDADNNDVVLKIDIRKMLESLYIEQYLTEFKEYFRILDDELAANPTKSSQLLTETKIALLSRSNIINSFAKGTLKGIEVVLGLFCKNLGEYTFRVETSPLGNNFIYRITSDMPKVYWTSIIKEIVHPISWRDEYIQIDNGKSQLPTLSVELPITNKYDAYATNTRDYQNRYKLHIESLKNIPLKHLDVDMDPEAIYYGDTRYYESSMIENMNSATSFNFKPNQYSVDLQYNNPELISILNEPEQFITQTEYDTALGTISLDMEFLLDGIATQYYFEVKHGAKVLQKVTLVEPNYRCKLPMTLAGNDIQVDLTLINGTFSTTVSTTVALPAA